jgi:ribosome-associated heat shock protein Hsp15
VLVGCYHDGLRVNRPYAPGTASDVAIIRRMDRVRVDRWLWAARFYKTRGAATEAVMGGRVHLNAERVKPAKDVRVGDRLEVTVGDIRRTVVVRGLAEKRGPAAVAAMLYEETPESVALREQRTAERRLTRPLGADLGARPTKQDRRRLDALRRAQRRSRP